MAALAAESRWVPELYVVNLLIHFRRYWFRANGPDQASLRGSHGPLAAGDVKRTTLNQEGSGHEERSNGRSDSHARFYKDQHIDAPIEIVFETILEETGPATSCRANRCR